MLRNLVWLVFALIAVAMLNRAAVEKPSAPPPPTPTETPEIRFTQVAGDWALDANGYRLLLELTAVGGGWTGRLHNEDGAWEGLTDVEVQRTESPYGPVAVSFYRDGPSRQWYRCTIEDGKIQGRFSHKVDKPRDKDFRYKVTGVSPPPEGWTVGHTP